MTEQLFTTPQPSVLLVIGTFAAVPYIHLQLESRRRLCPDVPCLVHDDCSPVAGELRELCAVYGAEYVSPGERLRPNCGDLSTTLLAIQSAQARGLDLAVKMSRRFVPLTDWTSSLRETAAASQYATYSNRDDGYGLGFRTECVAFHAPTWATDAACGQIAQAIQSVETSSRTVEPFLHGLARAVHARSQCDANRAYESRAPANAGTGAYGVWPWMGHDRRQRHAAWVWHQSDTPLDYERLARAYGLPYRAEDFDDPNMGHGQGYR